MLPLPDLQQYRAHGKFLGAVVDHRAQVELPRQAQGRGDVVFPVRGEDGEGVAGQHLREHLQTEIAIPFILVLRRPLRVAAQVQQAALSHVEARRKHRPAADPEVTNGLVRFRLGALAADSIRDVDFATQFAGSGAGDFAVQAVLNIDTSVDGSQRTAPIVSRVRREEARVEETAPRVHQQGADNVWKDATLDNGVKVMVPPFITAGEKIVVDPKTREFVRRDT